jgi:hypothetical protein
MSTNDDYFVTGPVDGGYSWWDVRARESQHGPNFSVASFFREMSNAEREARRLCRRLNATAKV